MKDVWHKVDSGELTRDGKDYEYVIEQNKNEPIETSARLRITKVKPTVQRIRTRYEPHVDIVGDAGAVVPSYFGYDVKRLANMLTPILFGSVFVMMVDGFFLNNFLLSLIPKLSSTPSAATQNIIGFAFKLFAFVTMMAFFIIPVMVRWVHQRKLKKELLKDGLPYAAICKDGTL